MASKRRQRNNKGGSKKPQQPRKKAAPKVGSMQAIPTGHMLSAIKKRAFTEGSRAGREGTRSLGSDGAWAGLERKSTTVCFDVSATGQEVYHTHVKFHLFDFNANGDTSGVKIPCRVKMYVNTPDISLANDEQVRHMFLSCGTDMWESTAGADGTMNMAKFVVQQPKVILPNAARQVLVADVDYLKLTDRGLMFGTQTKYDDETSNTGAGRVLFEALSFKIEDVDGTTGADRKFQVTVVFDWAERIVLDETIESEVIVPSETPQQQPQGYNPRTGALTVHTTLSFLVDVIIPAVSIANAWFNKPSKRKGRGGKMVDGDPTQPTLPTTGSSGSNDDIGSFSINPLSVKQLMSDRSSDRICVEQTHN